MVNQSLRWRERHCLIYPVNYFKIIKAEGSINLLESFLIWCCLCPFQIIAHCAIKLISYNSIKPTVLTQQLFQKKIIQTEEWKLFWSPLSLHHCSRCPSHADLSYLCCTIVSPVHIPWQDFSSVNNLNPFLQLQSKLPTVFLQKWSQPPLLDWHSSISVTKQKKKLQQIKTELQHSTYSQCQIQKTVTSSRLEKPRNKI